MFIHFQIIQTSNQRRNAQTIDENVVRLVRIGEQLGDDVQIRSNLSRSVQQILKTYFSFL